MGGQEDDDSQREWRGDTAFFSSRQREGMRGKHVQTLLLPLLCVRLYVHVYPCHRQHVGPLCTFVLLRSSQEVVL